MIPALNRIEQKILAVLEEAGEDYVVALINTLYRPTGDVREVASVTDALLTLNQKSLVEFEKEYCQEGWRTLPVNRTAVRRELEELRQKVTWSPVRHCWEAHGRTVWLRVVLTQLGMLVSERLLREYGWDLTQPE